LTFDVSSPPGFRTQHKLRRLQNASATLLLSSAFRNLVIPWSDFMCTAFSALQAKLFAQLKPPVEESCSKNGHSPHTITFSAIPLASCTIARRTVSQHWSNPVTSEQANPQWLRWSRSPASRARIRLRHSRQSSGLMRAASGVWKNSASILVLFRSEDCSSA